MSDLLDIARAARERSYSPYSGFAVGAAIRLTDGTTVSAANVENASYGLSICAERSAVFKLIAERGTPSGDHGMVEIAIAGDPGTPAYPCGACRQVISEFASHIKVILEGGDDAIEMTMDELFPHPFELDNKATTGGD